MALTNGQIETSEGAPLERETSVDQGGNSSKSGAVEKIRARCQLGLATLCLATGMSVATPQKGAEAAPLNAPSVSQEVGGNASIKSLEQGGFSSKFAREMDRLSMENRERIARGELPNEPEYIFSVDFINPIHDAKGMDTIVNGGSSIPKADEKKLSLPGTLSESTYEATLDHLFDGSDIDVWIRNTDGSEMTSEKKALYRERLTNDRARYIARLAEIKSAPNGSEIISTFFGLYNAGKKTITYPSRESYRRLFVASLSIAGALYAPPEKQTRIAALVMTQIGEYILLTDPNTGIIVKVGIGELKYFTPSSESIKGNPVLAKIPTMSAFYGISDMALTKIQKDNTLVIENGKAKIRIAQKEGVLAQKEERIALSVKIRHISDEIGNLIVTYNKNSSTILRQKIEQQVSILQVLQGQLQKFSPEDTKESNKLAQITIALYEAVIKK